MTNYRYLGYGVTNENGVAKLKYNSEGQEIQHSYTGVGAGEVDVLASLDNPITEGSIVSETLPVLDGLYFEDGKSDKSANWNLSNVTYSSDGEAVTLNNASGGNRWCTLKIGSSTSYLDSTLDYCMEIDVKKDTATDIRLILDNTNVYVQSYVSASDFTHIKIYTSRSQSKVFYIIDGVTREVAMATANGNIQFRVANGESYSFKNFVVYPI